MCKETSNQVTEMYPYTYVYKGEKNILIWQTGEDVQDSFKVDSKDYLFSAQTEEELKKLLGPESKRVHWGEYAEINLDDFWRAVKNLRAGRGSSSKTCELLLNGWNFIEDLLRTFGLIQEMEKLRSPLLNKVYEKNFRGNNLPAVTPEGKSYTPIWLREETTLFRKEISLIWKILENKVSKFKK